MKILYAILPSIFAPPRRRGDGPRAWLAGAGWMDAFSIPPPPCLKQVPSWDLLDQLQTKLRARRSQGRSPPTFSSIEGRSLDQIKVQKKAHPNKEKGAKVCKKDLCFFHTWREFVSDLDQMFEQYTMTRFSCGLRQVFLGNRGLFMSEIHHSINNQSFLHLGDFFCQTDADKNFSLLVNITQFIFLNLFGPNSSHILQLSAMCLADYFF